MVALLVALTVMGVLLGAVLPVYSTLARRERETELVFRGEQYARAIRLYQQQFGNALPPDVDTLLGMKFLRREYLDPITGEEFQYLGPNDPELAAALNSEPAAAGDDDEDVPENDFQRQARESQNALQQLVQQTGGAGGGIIAVTSKSTAESLRVYNGHDHYNEWVFIALQQSQQAGTGAEGGAAGGRGNGQSGFGLAPQRGGGRGGLGAGRGGRGGRGVRGGRGDAAPRGGGRGGFGGGGRGGRGF